MVVKVKMKMLTKSGNCKYSASVGKFVAASILLDMR